MTRQPKTCLFAVASVVLVMVSLAWPRHAEARLRITVDLTTPQVGVVVRGGDNLCRVPARPYVVIDRHDHRTARALARRFDCSPARLLAMRRDGHTWAEIRAFLRHSPHPVRFVRQPHLPVPDRCGTHAH